MKECKYINCNTLHSKRGDYCKPSHKTRQWEYVNGKKNPITNKSTSKRSGGIYDTQMKVIEDFVAKRNKHPQNQNNGALGARLQRQYRSEFVPRKATFNATKIALGVSSFNEIRKTSGKRNIDNVGMAFIWGLGLDLIWNLIQGNTKEILYELPIVEERTAQASPAQASITRTENKNNTTNSPIISAVSYRNQKIDTIKFDSHYRYLLGKPPQDFYMIVHGQSGHGKSYWTIQFSEYFQRNHGDVIYFAAEQRGINLAVQNILNEVKGTFKVHTEPRNLTLSDIIKFANQYDMIVFDSFNEMNLQPEEIKQIRQSSKAAIVGVLQSTKDGNFKGENTWLHDTDIMVQLVNRVPNTEQKARYQSSDTKLINITSNA